LIQYNAAAKGMYATNVCPGFTTAAGGPGQAGLNSANGGTLAAFCDPDWQFFQGGVRTMWTPVPGFFLGVDVFYTHVFTAFKGATASVNGVNVSGTTGATTLIDPIIGARPRTNSPASLYRFDDEGTVGAVFRAQRNFNAGD
jgi:hypothetical protein